VLYYNLPKFQGKQQKWQRKFSPHLVVRELPPVNYLIQKTRKSRPFFAHVDKLKPYENDNVPKSWLSDTDNQPSTCEVKANCEELVQLSSSEARSTETNGHSEDVVGRSPPVRPVSVDEINSQAESIDVTELVQGGDVAVHSSADGVFNGETGNVGYAVSPSTVCEANVEPVVSTMGFADLNEGNDDAGQHERSENPGMNDDVVPVLGSLVQGDADRRQSTTLGTVANADDGSGPRHRSSGPGGLLVNEGRSTGKSDADGADVLVFVPMGHGQHGCSTAMGQGYRGLCHLNNGVGAGRQRCKSRPNNVPVRPRSYTFGRIGDEMTSKQPMVTNEDACASSSSTQPSRAEADRRQRLHLAAGGKEHADVDDTRIAGDPSATNRRPVRPRRIVRRPARYEE